MYKNKIIEMYEKYHKPEFLKIDPLCVVHEFEEDENLEIVALLSASLAYGKVAMIIKSIREILRLTENDPLGYSKNSTLKDKEKLFADFKHRFNTGEDIALLFEIFSKIHKEYGSLKNFSKDVFVETETKNMYEFMTAFASHFLNEAAKIKNDVPYGFKYMFPLPEKKSACKRLNMFFRWMVREDDGIDLGLWSDIPKSILQIPVDTHVLKVSKKLKLTTRKQADWRASEEITNNLRKISPDDPVKFDFSLCRYGMVEL